MASDIDIASAALQMIGGTSISSFTQSGGDAATANALYEDIARDVLATHFWRFAMKKQSLNKLSQTPLNEYQNAFQVPTDKIRIERVQSRIGYKIFQDKIYSNADTIELDYLFRADTSSWPAYFVLLMKYKCASAFAMPVTQNQSIKDSFEIEYVRQLGKSFTIDSQEQPQTPIEDQPFSDVRF